MMQLVAGFGIVDENGNAITPGTVLDGQVAYGKLQGGKLSTWRYRYDYSGSLTIKGYVSLIWKDPYENDYDPYSYSPQEIDATTKAASDVYFTCGRNTMKDGSHHGSSVSIACTGMDRLSKIFFEPTTSDWASGDGTIIVSHINDRSGT